MERDQHAESPSDKIIGGALEKERKKIPVFTKPKKEPDSENNNEPSLMHNLNVLALAASPEIRQMEEGRSKNSSSNNGSTASSVDGETKPPQIGNVRKQFQAALESATPESQLMLHDYEISTCHSANSKQRQKPNRPVKTRNRKTKSLAVISRRFLERLPIYPTVGDPVIISLNHLPAELGVERRRIYDILNILESVEMVRRLGRNQYQYLGYARLPQALAELKHQGHCEGLKELIEIAERERRDEIAEKRERRKRETEAMLASEKKKQMVAKANAAQRSQLSTAIELLASAAGKIECDESGVEEDEDSSSSESSSPSSPTPASDIPTSSSSDYKPTVASTRQIVPGQTALVAPPSLIVADHNSMTTGGDDAASLGVICRRFLMLLLVSEPPVVTLNTAARVVGCQASSAAMPKPTIINAAGQTVHVTEKENNGPAIGAASSRYNSSTVFKSKLRRLYDVTNVLATVGLVKREVDGVSTDKAEEVSENGSHSAKESKLASEDAKPEVAEKKPDVENSSSEKNSGEKKLKGPVFRYTGPSIDTLPPVSASRLSELPSSAGGHRQGSHAKSSANNSNAKCQVLVRNGSTVCIPPNSASSGPSLVIVPGAKPLRIVPSIGQGTPTGSANDDSSPRQIAAPPGSWRARTFTAGFSQQGAIVMPSTPLLAPPRLSAPNYTPVQQNSVVRPNSLLGKLLGSQSPATVAGSSSPMETMADNKRLKTPSTKRVVLSSEADGFSAKQSRLACPPSDPVGAQERIVVIGASPHANANLAADSRVSMPLIVSHAQLSMQKSSQNLISKHSRTLNTDGDDEVVVVVQDQAAQSSSAKIILTDKPSASPGGSSEFAANPAAVVSTGDVNSSVKGVADWLC